MDDYISRQAAIDRLNEQRKGLKPDKYQQDRIGDFAYRVCAEIIGRLHPADVRPVVRGRWGTQGDRYIRCSCCKHRPPSFASSVWLSDFCPHCGADMRRESNG